MTAPLTVLEFRARLERSGLLDPDLVDAFFRDRIWRGDATEEECAVAEAMIAEHLLTSFQAGQLLKGFADDFFLTDKYKILECVGEGGMGKVYLCEHLILHRLVAVKMLQLPGQRDGSSAVSAVERFYREARAVAALDHPNIVRVFDVDRRGNDPFMVMEFVDGTDLKELVRRRGALPAERAADYIRQAASGLVHAHAAGLIHRDIKPSNLLLDRAGVVKVLDLGLARFSQDLEKNRGLTSRFDAHVVLGTVDFMAPEQASDSARADVRSDIYSLGCTLYYLLTGRVPFPEGTIAQKMYAHTSRAPDSPSELFPRIPGGLIWVLDRMMAKDPDERYQSAGEVVDAFAGLADAPEPPPGGEMPETAAFQYRLGLCLPPVASPLQATPSPSSQATAGPESPRSRSSSEGSPRRPPPVDADPSFVVAAPAPPASPPTSAQRATIGVLTGLLLAAAGVIVWLASRGQDMSPPKDKDVNQSPAKDGPFVGVILRGGGSTFVNPVMQQWAGVYEKRHGARIDYQAVGSGKGTQGVIDRVYTFACTESTQTDDQSSELMHVPLVMGAVVPAYNLPDVTQPLRFTGPALAGIYLGTITRWNDPALRASNPGIALPDLPITIVGRVEASGTTFIWTDYLSRVSAAWRDKHGARLHVKVHDMLEGRGNSGVADLISRTVGAIGCVELTCALGNDLRFGLVRNRAGKYVAPNQASVTAAAAASLTSIPADLRYSLTDAPSDDSYPIAATTWAVIHVDQTNNPSARELVEFLRWATHAGQAYVQDLGFAPLPPELIKRIDDKLAMVKLPSKKE